MKPDPQRGGGVANSGVEKGSKVMEREGEGC
jgi:hypothetical protein